MGARAVRVYVAAWISSKGDRVRDVTYGLIPFSVLIGVVASLIVLQPDVSTALLIVMTAVAMFFYGGADILQLTGGGIIGGATFAIIISNLHHARERLRTWRMIWTDPRNLGYHSKK